MGIGGGWGVEGEKERRREEMIGWLISSWLRFCDFLEVHTIGTSGEVNDWSDLCEAVLEDQ